MFKLCFLNHQIFTYFLFVWSINYLEKDHLYSVTCIILTLPLKTTIECGRNKNIGEIIKEHPEQSEIEAHNSRVKENVWR